MKVRRAHGNEMDLKLLTTKRSKSKKAEHYLLNWRYEFGNPDLFSHQEIKSAKIKAVLDCCVLIRMRDPLGPENKEAHALLSDWLQELADFVYTPETFNEIKRDANRERIINTKQLLKRFDHVQFKPDLRDKIAMAIEELKPGKSENDISDRNQLAECIASETNYFITHDNGILDLSEELFKRFSLRVLTPTDFILLVDEQTNALDYNAFRLAGANYDHRRIKGQEIDELASHFAGVVVNEKKHSLKTTIVNCAADARNSAVRIIKNANNEPIAVYGQVENKESLKIPFVRIKDSKISVVLFQQLIKETVALAIARKKHLITIDDSHFSTRQETILNSMGFEKIEGSWRKIALRGAFTFNDLVQHNLVASNFDIEKIVKMIDEADISFRPQLKVQLEKKLWPAKILDLAIPVYVIPIKPLWAGQLFDFNISNSEIFAAKEGLMWSRENVYYRNVKPVSEKAPARILWYLSGDSKSVTGRQKGIAACSYLDEVYVNRVKIVFAKFQHYGIYQWDHVYSLAKKELLRDIKALKFSDTEVFKKVVPLKAIGEIFERHGQRANTFASPVEIQTEAFNEIYKLGVGNE
jgi:predicted nucleic acid-binding protein